VRKLKGQIMKILITALAGCIALPAVAQTQTCAAREAVIAQLAQRWGEARVSAALAGQQALIETWANAETGNWTLTLTRPDGVTCLIMAGEGWQSIAAVPGVQG
jgi:hypothetical protein